MDRQYRENSARNTYSNYNQMRAYVECSPNQSKKIPYRPFHRAIDETLRVPEQCWPFLYLNFTSSALTAQAFKMVITTVCVQIDNCFCVCLTKVISWHAFFSHL